MQTVNVHEAKTQLSRLLEAVEAGEEVVIARAGRPVARLVGMAPAAPRRRLGLLAGRFTVPDDFDAPLPDDMQALFEGR
jgi:prevent-host-death family protein